MLNIWVANEDDCVSNADNKDEDFFSVSVFDLLADDVTGIINLFVMRPLMSK